LFLGQGEERGSYKMGEKMGAPLIKNTKRLLSDLEGPTGEGDGGKCLAVNEAGKETSLQDFKEKK